MVNPVAGDVTAMPAQPDALRLLERGVGALAERFRTLSEAKLAGSLPPHGSRAAAGRHLAQLLADAALGVAGRQAAGPPAWREVPELDPFAVGDQIAVTGYDLVAALAGVAEAEQVWTRQGRRPAGDVTAAALDAVKWLRQAV